MVCLQLRACEAKPSPYLPLDPPIPSHVQGACNGAEALHAFQKL